MKDKKIWLGMKYIVLAFVSMWLGCSNVSGEQGSTNSADKNNLKISISEKGIDEPLPCRIRIYKADEKIPFVHNVCDGEFETAVEPGKYRIIAERGHEYLRFEQSIKVEKDKVSTCKIELKRAVNLAEQGWWSGDMHSHLKPEDLKLHMLAEDLHIVPCTNWWSGKQQYEVDEPVVYFTPDHAYSLMTQEHEPGNQNAMIYSNLKPPVVALTDKNMVAGLLKMKEKDCWAEIEKPYIWDTPALMATGKIDSIEIAPNPFSWFLKDDYQTVKDIKWGRLPREELEKYPGLWKARGFYIQDLYYKLLNCGFRVPPSAGTAGGIVNVPVGLGYNRVYVYLGKDFSWQKWFEQFRLGRCFVTNGPILMVKANGVLPGEVFSYPEGKKVKLKLDVNILASNDPVVSVELIRDGEIARKVEGRNLKGKIDLGEVEFEKSGWFLVRCINDVPYDTLRFASCAPFYVEIGENKKTIHREDVEYFINWLQERMDTTSKTYRKNEKKEYYLKPYQDALEYFKGLLK